MKKTFDIILTVAAALFALAVVTNSYLANHDSETNQRLAQAEQFLQQRVPQSRTALQNLALRVNQSVPQSPALKQVLENLRVQVSANQPSVPSTTPIASTTPAPNLP